MGSGRSSASPDDRPIVAEYHAQGMLTGGFMLKHGCYKYCAYAGHASQLFDIVDDPDENDDLATDPHYAAVQHDLAALLGTLVDIDAVDARARTDQQQRSLPSPAS